VVACDTVKRHARVSLFICNTQDNALSKESSTQIVIPACPESFFYVIPAKAGIHVIRYSPVLPHQENISADFSSLPGAGFVVPSECKENMMTKNIGDIERIIRIAAGLAIFSLVFVGPKSLWGLFGLFPLVTGFTGFCVPYHLLGINTCRKCKKEA
jgi:hypothetical protein